MIYSIKTTILRLNYEAPIRAVIVPSFMSKAAKLRDLYEFKQTHNLENRLEKAKELTRQVLHNAEQEYT